MATCYQQNSWNPKDDSMQLQASKQASLGVTRFKKQSVKTSGESLDDKVGPKTTKHVW